MSEIRTPPCKLVDLNPVWLGLHGTDRKGVALAFQCPCLDPKCGWGGQVVVDLENPLDGGPRVSWRGSEAATYWKRTGDTFETLTLSPSIWAKGHWHGWIKNGEVVSV